jgi:hypothetical protein
MELYIRRNAQKQDRSRTSDAPRLAAEKVMEQEWNMFVVKRDSRVWDDDVQFWKLHCAHFPHVFKVFVQVRGIRPGTAQLEAVFNIAFLGGNRSSSSSETQNNVLMVKTNPIRASVVINATNRVGKPGNQGHKV